MVSPFTLDRTGLAVVSFGVLFAGWLILDTRRCLTLLSLNRKRDFTPLQLMVIKVPGVLMLVGSVLAILVARVRL